MNKKTDEFSNSTFCNFFSRPRTVPAVAAIFSEARVVIGTVRKRDVRRLYQQIKKKSTFQYRGRKVSLANSKSELPSYNQIKFALRRSLPRTIGFVTKAYNYLNQFRLWIAKKMYKKLPHPFKKLVKKMGRIEAHIHKKLVCWRPRLERRYGRLIYPEGLSVLALKEKKKDFIKDFIEFVENGNAEDEAVEYVEDCFDDMERPKFGYRVKLMLKEKEPCDYDFKNPDQSTCILPSNTNVKRIGTGTLKSYAQSRQTGEEFSSAAPTDCRINFICDSIPTTAATAPTLTTTAQTPNTNTEISTQATPQTTQPTPVPAIRIADADSQTNSQLTTETPTQAAPSTSQPSQVTAKGIAEISAQLMSLPTQQSNPSNPPETQTKESTTQPTATTASGITETIASLMSQSTLTLTTKRTTDSNEESPQTTQVPPQPQMNSDSPSNINTNVISSDADPITVTSSGEKTALDIFDVYRSQSSKKYSNSVYFHQT